MVNGVYGSAGYMLTLRDNPKGYFKAYYLKHKKRIQLRQKQNYDANPQKYRDKSRENREKKQKLNNK